MTTMDKLYQITNRYNGWNVCIDLYGDADVSAPQHRPTAEFSTREEVDEFIIENHLNGSDWVVEMVKVEE